MLKFKTIRKIKVSFKQLFRKKLSKLGINLEKI